MPELAYNKRAGFDFELLDRYEAGLVLTGQEVKSVKTGHVSLRGAFITRHQNELFLTNANIPFYPFAGDPKGYDPTHPRKLLLRRSEIKHLLGKMSVEGLTVVPLRVYTKKRLVKLEFAVARGKKQFDKRQSIKKREATREAARMLKSY